jgi:hypothetical protein
MATKYSDWAPSQFDTRGLGLPDRQDWFVLGYMQTRDSNALERSNFRVALRELTRMGVEHETHRFGHWGPGWIDIIIVHPEGLEKAETLEGGDYPVLDDSDFSEAEIEDEQREWDSWGEREWKRVLYRVTGCERAIDALSSDDLWELYRECSDGPEHHDDGPHFGFDLAGTKVERDKVVALVRMVRADKRARKLGFKAYDGTHLRRDALVVITPESYEQQHDGSDLTAPRTFVCTTWRQCWILLGLYDKGEWRINRP